MQKIAFTMKLRPGFKEEYKRRHDAIWPGLRSLLKKSGISDYSIFLDDRTDTLFAVQRNSGNHSSSDLSGNEIIRKWWTYMADIMETNADHSPVMHSLEMMFHLD